LVLWHTNAYALLFTLANAGDLAIDLAQWLRRLSLQGLNRVAPMTRNTPREGSFSIFQLKMKPRHRLTALTCLKAEGPQQAPSLIAVNRSTGPVRFSANARFIAALTFVTLVPFLAQAQDIEMGREIATKWCSNCHNVFLSARTFE
jgi:hypothetical protein